MEKQCIVCRKMFHTHPSEFERRKTCSRDCSKISKSIATKGRKKSEEHKRKIALAHTGKKRKPFSKEWKDNLSKARKGKKLTKEHCKNMSLANMREKGSNWQGGKTEKRKNSTFRWIKYPKHPRANNSGFIRVHRHVMEQHLGRFLISGEVIHHINGDPTDDRLKNLQLFPNNSEHIKFHMRK